MSLTQRFGLSVIGGADGAKLSDQGTKFGHSDRLTLDKILAALETHVHGGGTRLDDPVGVPGLTQVDVGGALPGATTFYYRVSYVDRFGLETVASDEASITTPGKIAAPSPPELTAVSGGTLTPGTYFYALTVVKDGYETQISGPAVITLQAGQGTVRITLPALPAGADSYNIWRQGSTETYYTKIGSGTPPSVDDDGSVPPDDCPTDPSKLPPITNQTNSSNVVTVAVPEPARVGADPSDIKAWRIYRTRTSGVYGPETLVAEITDTQAGGGLVTSWEDVGSTLLRGFPKEVSQTLLPSQPISGLRTAPVLLQAADTQVWRIVADADGRLVTRTSDAEPAGGIVLVDADDIPWKLTVANDGTLVTSQEAAGPSDVVWSHPDGPYVPTTDPTTQWQLRVGTAGELVTVLI